MQKEWLRQSTYVRFWIVGLCLAVSLLDYFTHVLSGSRVFAGGQVVALTANAVMVWNYRRNDVRPWHLWAMMVLDSLIIAVLVAAVGEQGYLGIAFFLVAGFAYSLNIPRAARMQIGLAAVCYPVARAIGLSHALGHTPIALIAAETLVLVTLGYKAIAGPIRFTYRVRGARKALSALARGDFSVRLPARALDDLGFLAVSFNATAAQLGDAMRTLEGEVEERTRAEQALRASREALAHQAFHDQLTGLANRTQFRDHVAAALAEHSPDRTAVLAVDLDGFKVVNDTFGHAAGDALLREVAARLLSATRGCDLVARLGGDEFAVLLRFLHDDAETRIVAERILHALDAPIALGDRHTSVGASIGFARGAPGRPGEPPAGMHGGDAVDAILHDADVALYHAKQLGKGRWAAFDPSMNDAAAERRTLERELRRALAREELSLVFQPMVSLASGRVRRLESLLRWTHPTRGAIPPNVFIPLAEESGQIVALGRWVLVAACRQLACWQRTTPDPADPVSLCVNISGRQLQHPGFVKEVDAIVRDTGVLPGTLILELTESAVIHQPEVARARMLELKARGVRFAIDDFGTGYSSLSYLQHFPIDVLKVDRSFMEGVTREGPAQALVRTIIQLGKALSLETVAEGIETAEQRECVEAMGADFGQGYLFARPMPADQAELMLSSSDSHAEAGVPG